MAIVINRCVTVLSDKRGGQFTNQTCNYDCNSAVPKVNNPGQISFSPPEIDSHHIWISAKKCTSNGASWRVIWPLISRGWLSDRNLHRGSIKWYTRDKSDTLSHLLLMQSKASLHRLSNQHLGRGRESENAVVKVLPAKRMVLRQAGRSSNPESVNWLVISAEICGATGR